MWRNVMISTYVPHYRVFDKVCEIKTRKRIEVLFHFGGVYLFSEL